MAIGELWRELLAGWRGAGEREAWARALADEHERLAAYRRAWQAYYGAYREALPVSAARGLAAEDNVKLNYARAIVDKGVHALCGRPPAFDLDARPGERCAAERWLDACLAANHWPSLLVKAATNGAVCGQAYIKMMEGATFPRLTALSPEYVTVVTDADDVETARQYIIEWAAGGGEKPTRRRQTITRDEGAGGRWRIIDEQAEGRGGWETLSVSLWPYPWPPIHDCQNLPQANLYYGLPDLTPDLLDLVETINYVASNIVRITRHHAHPKTWGRGFRAQEIKLAVNEIMVLPSENAELRNLEMAGNLGFSHKTLDTLREVLHELAALPEVTSGKLENIGPLSGVALGILYSPLVERVETKRASYGPMLEALAGHLLELSPLAGGRPKLVWPDAGPGHPLEKRQALLLEQQLGVSRDTILTKLGYDPAVENGKRGEK